MLRRRFLVTIAALTICISAVSAVSAQDSPSGLSMGPSARPFADINNPLTDDFFGYDAQLWAPAELTSLDGAANVPTGFYFTFDYSYQSTSRPAAPAGVAPQSTSTGNDYYWGKTYRFGFMGETGKGFGVRWLSLDGVSFVNGQDILDVMPMLLDVEYNVVDLNREFRQMLSSGGYVEPYVGFKYIAVNDSTIQDNQLSQRFVQRVSNSALGGQVGSRFVKKTGRFQVETEGALSALYNNQSYFSTDVATATTVSQITNAGHDFIPGLELAIRFSYDVTRDISIRAGGELTYLWEGIARADTRATAINPNSVFGPGPTPTSIMTVQDFLAAGFSFGVDWRH